MLFRIASSQDTNKDKFTHAGVLEFIAEEGRCYVPQWLMLRIGAEEGHIVTVQNCALPLGLFVKMQAQELAFLDIADPRAVLEQAFRNFSTMTPGDLITIQYNKTQYSLLVIETKPRNGGISIVETDLEVDFATPLGYVEPDYKALKQKKEELSIDEHVVKSESSRNTAFAGSGNRMNGKLESTSYGKAKDNIEITNGESVPPNALVLPPGLFFFGYPVVPLNPVEANDKKIAFAGPGTSLRQAIKGIK